MTQAEKKREEIRKLNLRVDELKAQNETYAQETEEIEKKVSENREFLKKSSKDVLHLQEEIDTLESTREALVGEIKDYTDKRKEIAADYEKVIKDMADKSAAVEAMQKDLDNARAQLEELENEMSEKKSSLNASMDSLNAFKDELMTKEALLKKRAETLDLREQGVNI